MTMLETQKTTFTANDWLNYFKENARQRQSIPWERGIIAEPYLRGPLIRSLQRFQVVASTCAKQRQERIIPII